MTKEPLKELDYSFPAADGGAFETARPEVIHAINTLIRERNEALLNERRGNQDAIKDYMRAIGTLPQPQGEREADDGFIHSASCSGKSCTPSCKPRPQEEEEDFVFPVPPEECSHRVTEGNARKSTCYLCKIPLPPQESEHDEEYCTISCGHNFGPASCPCSCHAKRGPNETTSKTTWWSDTAFVALDRLPEKVVILVGDKQFDFTLPHAKREEECQGSFGPCRCPFHAPKPSPKEEIIEALEAIKHEENHLERIYLVNQLIRKVEALDTTSDA